MNIIVSIIIPAKNEEKMIAGCLTALKKIDFPSEAYEIIVVDNGSEDATADIAKSFGVRVFIISDVSISALRNYGAAQSNGEYLAFVDADVMVTSEWLKNALAAFEDERVACTGSTSVIPKDTTWVERTWFLQTQGQPARAERTWLASMNLIVRRKVFNEVGGFNEKLLTCEDVDLGYRISENYIILEDKSIAAVHLGEAKSLYQLFRKEMWRGKSNYSGVLEHGLKIDEVPSLIIPLFYLGIILLVPTAIIIREPIYIGYGFLASVIFPILQATIICGKLKRFNAFTSLLAVWWVYGFARAFSIFLEIQSSLSSFKRKGSKKI